MSDTRPLVAAILFVLGCGGAPGARPADGGASADAAATADASPDGGATLPGAPLWFRAADNPQLHVDFQPVTSECAVEARGGGGAPLPCSLGFELPAVDVTQLVATFTFTGAVTVNGVVQVSDVTPNDFTSFVTYEISTARGPQAYNIFVSLAPASAKDLSGFGFGSADNAALTADASSVADAGGLAVTVPAGADLHALVASFQSFGVVTVGSVPQASGVTANDFTQPVVYHVTAVDGSTADYTVTVTRSRFAAEARIAMTGEPGALATNLLVGDFDGDGRSDLATIDTQYGSADGQPVAVLTLLVNTTVPGAAKPSFAPQVDIPMPATVTGRFAAADLDGDGRLDVVAVDDGHLDILLNQTTTAGAPRFGGITSLACPAAVAVAIGDLDRDGIPDLAVANGSASSVSVFLGTSLRGAAVPTFAPRVDFATGAFSGAVAIADFDGDGKPDLAVANLTDVTVSILRNTTPADTATPTFAPRSDFPLVSYFDGLAVADVNRDGAPDLVSLGDNEISVALNVTASGGPVDLAVAVAFPIDTEAMAVADLDGDDAPDVAVATAVDLAMLFDATPIAGSIPVLSSPRDRPSTTWSPGAIAIADINHDGVPDLIANEPHVGAIGIWLAAP